MNKAQRGLTLFEVLIATAILAVLAAAAVPTIMRAVRVLSDQPATRPIDVVDLAAVADSLVDDPEPFGYTNALLHAIDHLQINWPRIAEPESTVPVSGPIAVRSLRDVDPKADHIWLIFECEGVSIARWVAIPPAKLDTKLEETRP